MSDGRKYYCFCEANCRFETMSKEQILAAIAQAAETGLVFDTDAAFITKVKESNAGGFITFWVGTQAQYNAHVARDGKDPNCFYMFTDYDATAELAKKVNSLTAADVKARPETWTPTAADVGARPENWMPTAADVGAAPDGYGLGKPGYHSTHVTDLDALDCNGWYYVADKYSPIGQAGVLRVDSSRWDNLVHQTFYPASGGQHGYIMRRYKKNNTWEAWEWENPRMDAGVEYRTTERSSGSPVYAKKISATFSANNAGGTFLVKTPHGISGFNYLVDFFGKMGKTLLPTMWGDTYISLYQVDETNISFYVKDRAFSGGCTFILRYTKK